MPTLPNVQNEIQDGGGGSGTGASSDLVAVLGVATGAPTLLSAVTSSGTTPPVVTVSGTPLVDGAFKLDIQTGGALATATFRWSKNGGVDWVQSAVATAATVVLPGTGITVAFAAGTYAADNEYAFTAQKIPARFFRTKSRLESAFTGGPGVELGAHILSQENAPGLQFCPIPASVAGSSTTPVTTGTSPAVTLTGTPLDDGKGIVRFVLGGARAVATFKYSLDNGNTWSNEIVTAATYAIPGSGLTLNFATGTYVADDEYTWTSTAPGYTLTNLDDAATALRRTGKRFKAIFIVGRATGADDATKQSNARTMFEGVSGILDDFDAAHLSTHAFVESPDTSVSAFAAEWIDFADRRISICFGTFDCTSAITRRKLARSCLYAVAPRAAKTEISRDLAEIENGGALPAYVGDLHHDEYLDGGANEARAITLRTWPDRAGKFISNPNTMAAEGSDFELVQACFVMNELDAIVYSDLATVASKRLLVDPTTGFINEGEAKGLESRLQTKAEGKLGKHVSSLKVTITRDNDILTDKEVLYSNEAVPFAYPKTCRATSRYVNPATVAA